MKLSTPR